MVGSPGVVSFGMSPSSFPNDGDSNQPSAIQCPFCGADHAALAFGAPKTASGENRVVDLDSGTVSVLNVQRHDQDRERAQWGLAYDEHGLVFTRRGGSPLPQESVSTAFAQLAAEADLRHVRLHDLRHGQASLMLTAGVPLALVSKRLGHSSIAITSDTYTHLLEGVGRDAAESAAALVVRAPRATR